MGIVVLITIVAMLLALDLAALRWGVDSTDGPDSLEWERRRSWRHESACDGRGCVSPGSRIAATLVVTIG